MKLSLSWLKSHLDTEAGLDEIVRALTMLGLEVDEVIDRGAALGAFKVASVLSAEPHPNADKLRLCRVDTGSEVLQIVCGAPNARAGIKVVFAPIGTTIPRSGVVLKPTAIRGVDSQGMMCSGYELGLSEDHEGIIELPGDAPVGGSFAAFEGLDDPVLDVKITANRADCLGVRGLARDLAASGLGRLKPLAIPKIAGTYASPITVGIEDRVACPLFVGRHIRGVKNGPSPEWLARRLTSVGLRPISALVDITNFLTFDLARPLHVFDAGKLAGGLTVRPAEDGESLAALNGKDYALRAGMTVIADASGVLSLGGVMGGASTGCDETTTDVFLEVALFDTTRTAATGRALNLQSDARYRFERGVDPAFAFDAAELATQLILDLCGGEASELTIAGAVPEWRRQTRLRPARVAELGGLAVETPEIEAILGALGCEITAEGDILHVTLPSWRADLEGEADLVEEILRLHGYDDIPVVALPPLSVLPKPALAPVQRRTELVRRSLADRGLDEAVTFSFMSSALLDAESGHLFGGAKPELLLANPIASDLDSLRPSIVPNLLLAAKRNAGRGFGDVALFELGPQYADDSETGQGLVAAGVRVGRYARKLWNQPETPVDALHAKADALAGLVAAGVAVESLQITADAASWYHPGRSGTFRLGPKNVLAHFGELHPRLVRHLDLKGPAVAFEIYLDAAPLPKQKAGRPAFRPSPFQPLERDFAFIVDAETAAEEVLRAVRSSDRKLIQSVRLFDVYRGAGVPEGKKSLGVTVTLQPVEATPTDDAIEALSKTIVAAVLQRTGGHLR